MAVVQKTPLLMAQDDWRNQTQSILQDLLLDSSQLRTVSARVTVPPALRPQVTKLADDVEFVATEFQMALDFDPDATHLIRASRAEKSAHEEVDSVLSALR